MTCRETLVYMPYAIVAAIDTRSHRAIIGIAISCCIIYLMAIAVSTHISIYIGRIMAVINASGTAIVTREMIPIVR